MYRKGPHSLLLAFGHHLGDPRVKDKVTNRCLYRSREEIRDGIRSDERLLEDFFKEGSERSILTKVSENLVVARELLKREEIGYPVVVIGVENATEDDKIFFEKLGYSDLGLHSR